MSFLNAFLIVYINYPSKFSKIGNFHIFSFLSFRPTDLAVTLTESGKPDVTSPSWGQIFLSLTLIPKTQEEKEQVSKSQI